MAFTNQISKGQYILFEGDPCLIVDKEFVSPGKGSAFTRVKMNNLKTGKLITFTFKSGEKVNEIEVRTREYQYLFTDGAKYTFMDNETFEQVELPKEQVGAFTNFIKEGENYMIIIYDNKPIAFKPPLKVVRKITETQDAVKGNTATNATKRAILESGYEIDVPLFIVVGDNVSINTETYKYVERAN